MSFIHLSTAIFLIFGFLVFKSSRQIPLPPGPAPWPIVGSIQELFRKKPVFQWTLGLMKEMNTKIACFRFGDVHIIPVTCLEIAREFFKKQDAKFMSKPITMGTEYSSCGFLSIAVSPSGDQWKKMRRVVASEKRTEEADNLVRYVHNHCISGAVVNIRVAVRQYIGNVIRKMMFNKRYFGERRKDGRASVEEEDYLDALFTVLSLLYSFGKIMKEAIRIISMYHDPIIDERIRERREGKKKEVEDLLHALILVKDSNGEPLSSTEEIKTQALCLMLLDLIYASVDNPSNAIEWALAEMINQPKMVQKATKEIDQVMGKERLVQEEAFRLHPITPFNLPHVSSANTTVASYFIPKDSHVLLSHIGLGQNSKVWDLSVKVDLNEPNLGFISFSTRRRGCMGAALGSIITFMMLARLLQGFSWEVPHGSMIELNESMTDLFLAKPLISHAKPRLPVHAYPTPKNNF
ncbi:hypothetical protein NE237_030161 [Protea cynaroides]|uniref:Cytochrome P450 n=1 Tax=Protea cynaroides TaxID=273540 RepID=A0A9Q0JUK6_9MAGN|nr:hypothetical protein NE237_030161 [Protea cynaroides]